MTDTPTKTGPTRFGFLLINHFTLISMSSAVEPLRMANRICRDEVYAWKLISETGAAVRASDGLSINVDKGIDDRDVLSNVDAVIVCGGWNVEQNTSEPVLRWLRTIGQSGVAFGSTCTGSYLLASAGLLDGYRCSVHWENMAALTDLFPNIHVSRSVYTIDRDRYTCSGGTSPVDMMLHFIKVQCGNEVSTGVAEQFIHERIRRSGEHQRVPLKHVVGKQSEKLVIAVELMEANIKEPMSQADIASYTGVSRRQLQRLFERYLMCGPSRYYQQIRLSRARELLHQTSKNLVEISALTGFVSSSHFSKSYKEFFGHSPSAERRQ
ncbi:MAG: GlxA family transcriptional regulator [Proteobacteria bacterium]|nr:GlxA family transcriptional regulator [Pseudomonadota bacterium]